MTRNGSSEPNGTVDVIGIGPVRWDRFLIVPRLPGFNERVKAIRVEEGTGGAAATLLAALRRWKLRGRLISVIGHDESSQKIVADLTREGIEVDGLVRMEEAEGLSHTIVVDHRNGTRSVIEDPHTSSIINALRQDHLRDWWFDKARVLLVDACMEKSAIPAVAYARDHGLKVIATLHGKTEPHTPHVLRNVDWIVADEWIASELSKEVDPARAAYALHLMSDVPTIVTSAKHGTYYVQGRETIYQPRVEVPVVDPTGAHSMFLAGYIYGVLSAWDMPRTLRVASWVSAMACREVGHRKGIPTESQLKQFLHEP